MHNNFYFLRQLSPTLEKTLHGLVISACFSQNKDELVIRFETHQSSLYVKANLDSSFSCLSLTDNFPRARKNSIDLFPKLIGLHVKSVQQFENERSFALRLTDNFSLLFKMHGNRSNIILFENEAIVELFKNNMKGDDAINLNSLHRVIDWSYDCFMKNTNNLQSLYFTFGKVIWRYLSSLNFSALPSGSQWQLIQDVKEQLENPKYYITSINGTVHLTLVQIGNIIKQSQDPLRALNDFYNQYTRDTAYNKEKYAVISLLRSRLSGSENYYDKTLNKLNEVETDNNYKVWADLIMANLHAIPQGTQSVTVANFYQNDLPVEIKLKRELSPQKNAEVFYRKAKNQHLEIERLQQAISQKEKEIEKLKTNIILVESAPDLKSLRTIISEIGLNVTKEKQPEALPYHEFEFNTFKIWVGRNAQHNDTLTFRYGYKEDLWLHAKDVTGSHVLIKYQAGKNFPKDVIERAAQLAAYNSKRKSETLCPVIVTPKKFVRKRKGDLAGAVIVDREEVIMVTPLKD